MRSTLFAAAATTLLFAAPAQAERPAIKMGDATLTFDGRYRIRSFWDTGLDFVDDDPRHNVNHRAELGATYTGPDGLMMRFSFRDVRLWGEELNTLNDFTANGFDVYEAWAANQFGDKGQHWLRVGRQAVNLDDQRIVGAVDWVQRGRSFDGVRLKLGFGDYTVQAMGMRLVESHGRGGDGIIADPTVDESDMVAIHVHGSLSDAFKFSLLGMSVLQEDNTRTTAGTHITGKTSGLDYTGTFYFQSSEAGGESGSSTLMAVQIGYTLDAAWKPGVVARFEQLGGDGTPEGTFATPFATNHKFYGEMDFFLNTVRDTGNLGLRDIGGGLRLRPAQWMKVFVDVHAFQSVEPGPDDAQDFGLETDARLWIGLNKHQSIVTTYALFQPGDLFEARWGSEIEHFGYLTFDSRF